MVGLLIPIKFQKSHEKMWVRMFRKRRHGMWMSKEGMSSVQARNREQTSAAGSLVRESSG